MTSQNYKNHVRLIPLWHYITPLLLIAIVVGSILNLLHEDEHGHFGAVTLVVISVVLTIFYWYIRAFALRAQDRAIRAEENFRHFILTGKPFEKDLRLGQIVALRFASDEEFPVLVKRAIAEKMSQKEIKKAIKMWRGDYKRV
jgi:Na+/melibiose symporter-like transporter